MWYVYDVLYAVLFVRLSCFVVRGCAVSRKYIHVCNSDVFNYVVNMYPESVGCEGDGNTGVEDGEVCLW